MYVHVAVVATLIAGFVGLFVAIARKVEFGKGAKTAIKVLQVRPSWCDTARMA